MATRIGTPAARGVVDGFHRLRHDAVIGCNHQHHQVSDLCATCAHAGKRLVTWRIDKDNLAIVLLDGISADVLCDATRLASGDPGISNRVEQRCLAVVNVAHDGHHRSAAHQIGGVFGLDDFLGRFLLVTDLVGGRAKFTRQLFRELYIQGLVNGGEGLLLHQLLDDQVGLDAELFRKLFNRDAFGNGDLAIDGRRRGDHLALATLRAKSTFFPLVTRAAAGVAARGLGVLPARLFGRRRRGRFGPQRRRGMHLPRAGAGTERTR